MKRYVVAEKLGIVLALSLAFPLAGHAQEGASSSPYSFSGSCSTQGSWTRAALSQTSQVKQVIQKLKDNPACNALKNSMEANLTAMEGALKESDGLQANAGHARTLSQLPEDISALRTFSRAQSPFKSNVMDMLVGKTIQMSALSSSPAGDGENMTSISAIAERSRAAATTGLQLFNNTMSAFQEASQGCLDAGPTSAVIASGMVKILSSFAASNSGLNDQIALSVQKVSQYLARDKKYVDALRSLNDAEFITSMSCLVEIATESYCDALDAQVLFHELSENQNIKIANVRNPRTGEVQQKIVGLNQSFEKRLANGPLAGYYILTRQVPIVTDWLQKVQLGVTPQLPTQAEFKVTVSATVQNHVNTITRIEGQFNFGKSTLKSMSDLNPKQSQVLQILQDVASQMIGLPTQQYENFFTKVYNENEIIFGLLGMPIPPDVMNGMFVTRPIDWLKTNYRSIPVFADPNKLVDQIEKNMRVMFKTSMKESQNFYNQNFVVDRPQVVADSMIGLNTSVRSALMNIDNYLKGIEERVGQEKDSSNYPYIGTTRGKIRKVLDKYKELHKYSVEVLQLRKTDPQMTTFTQAEMDEKLKKVANDLLDEVYTQFEMKDALTGFLASRLSGIVLQDYTMSIKKGTHTGRDFEDIMLVSGYLAMNSMVNMTMSQTTDLKIDLAAALDINKKNIEALEKVVTGVFVRNIFNHKIRSENENITETQRNLLAYKWAYKMAEVQFPGENANALQRRARAHAARFLGDFTGKQTEYFGVSLYDRAMHPVKQIFNGLFGQKGNIVFSATSEFDTNKTMLGLYCTQTLAFANFTPYWALCMDSVLESPLKNRRNSLDPAVTKIIDNYLSVPYKKAAYENLITTKAHPVITGQDRARNIQSRICALSSYRNRNKIAEVTSAMRVDDENENTFLKEIAEEIKQVIK